MLIKCLDKGIWHLLSSVILHTSYRKTLYNRKQKNLKNSKHTEMCHSSKDICMQVETHIDHGSDSLPNPLIAFCCTSSSSCLQK